MGEDGAGTAFLILLCCILVPKTPSRFGMEEEGPKGMGTQAWGTHLLQPEVKVTHDQLQDVLCHAPVEDARVLHGLDDHADDVRPLPWIKGACKPLREEGWEHGSCIVPAWGSILP